MANAQPFRPVKEPLARFLNVKARSLASRARQLASLTPDEVGLRPEDMPYAPGPAHFAAANKRLQAIARAVRIRLQELDKASGASPDDQLMCMAMVEREIDRARRAFGMFF